MFGVCATESVVMMVRRTLEFYLVVTGRHPGIAAVLEGDALAALAKLWLILLESTPETGG